MSFVWYSSLYERRSVHAQFRMKCRIVFIDDERLSDHASAMLFGIPFDNAWHRKCWSSDVKSTHTLLFIRQFRQTDMSLRKQKIISESAIGNICQNYLLI